MRSKIVTVGSNTIEFFTADCSENPLELRGRPVLQPWNRVQFPRIEGELQTSVVDGEVVLALVPKSLSTETRGRPLGKRNNPKPVELSEFLAAWTVDPAWKVGKVDF